MALLLVVGVGLLLYPTVSDWWNSFHQSRAIADYRHQVDDNSQEDNEALWDEAVAYNASLSRDDGRFVPSPEEEQAYAEVLDVTGTGIMGYVDIPKIGVSLPIYHGIDEAVLQIAIGHIPGSSLPVGGGGTHTVISGHRGLPSARLFTDIDQLELGDRFTLHVLDQALTYEVDQIVTVLPDDIGELAIEDGRDYCTLVTCTPYGVNDHRLLVRGHRVPTEESDIGVATVPTAGWVLPAAIGVGVAILAIAVLGIRRYRRRVRRPVAHLK